MHHLPVFDVMGHSFGYYFLIVHFPVVENREFEFELGCIFLFQILGVLGDLLLSNRGYMPDEIRILLTQEDVEVVGARL
jgi:hypothetical protein